MLFPTLLFNLSICLIAAKVIHADNVVPQGQRAQSQQQQEHHQHHHHHQQSQQAKSHEQQHHQQRHHNHAEQQRNSPQRSYLPPSTKAPKSYQEQPKKTYLPPAPPTINAPLKKLSPPKQTINTAPQRAPTKEQKITSTSNPPIELQSHQRHQSGLALPNEYLPPSTNVAPTKYLPPTIDKPKKIYLPPKPGKDVYTPPKKVAPKYIPPLQTPSSRERKPKPSHKPPPRPSHIQQKNFTPVSTTIYYIPPPPATEAPKQVYLPPMRAKPTIDLPPSQSEFTPSNAATSQRLAAALSQSAFDVPRPFSSPIVFVSAPKYLPPPPPPGAQPTLPNKQYLPPVNPASKYLPPAVSEETSVEYSA